LENYQIDPEIMQYSPVSGS